MSGAGFLTNVTNVCFTCRVCSKPSSRGVVVVLRSTGGSRQWKQYSDLAGRLASSSSDQGKAARKSAIKAATEDNDGEGNGVDSAMSQRLEQMTEEALESGGHAARRAVLEEAGFDEQLRRRLQEKIASSASIRSEHPAAAFAQVELPASTGKGTRDIAGAKPWTGNEAVEDTALRVLTDAHKPLPTKADATSNDAAAIPRFPVPVVKKGVSSGSRLANARDRSSIYATLRDSGMSKEEREQFSKEMKARFQPTANNLPATISGLQSLANQRIEDAIARGQFKNLPRGKAIEVDHNANSPFIDTTEYIMNKNIKRQGIAPPWIEKQQEIANAARRFRTRLRNDWKRHAARLIASSGGTLEEQVCRAERYAIAEQAVQSTKAITNASDDEDDSMSQISASGQIKVRATLPHNKVAGTLKVVEGKDRRLDPPILPFRDLIWESTERSFHKLGIDSLNNMMRSYNLQAPAPTQKPYFNLERELKACYADVAPLLADEIRVRSQLPKAKFSESGTVSSSAILQGLDRTSATVHDVGLQRKGYGLRQFWKDLWAK
jgi:Domain of unknown function (DUF1992)